MDRNASSIWSQNAPKSDGSGNRSVASGLIWASIDFRSLAGRYVAREWISHGGVCWTGGVWIIYAVACRRVPSCMAYNVSALLACSS
jgi:hypothetical protein